VVIKVGKKIDDDLIKLAGVIIKIGAFFGITRWQLIVIWITVGVLAFFWAANIPVILKLVSIFLTLVFGLSEAYTSYREDNILSDGFRIRSATWRMTFFFLFLTLGLILQFGYSIITNVIICSARVIFNFQFWPYFCLNQTPKNPLRLKNLVKSFANRILSPAPKPAPVPISNFGSLD
jgi:hypothetical protein